MRFGVTLQKQSICIAPGATVQLAPGRLILLTGPSGSGKSSALSAIELHFAETSKSPLPRSKTRCGEADKGGSCTNVQQVEFSQDSALIDEILPHGDLADAAAILTACGLGEPALWLRPFSSLSDGEKFRAKLAKSIAFQCKTAQSPAQTGAHSAKSQPNSAHSCHFLTTSALICDEFCSNLHRRAARAIAHNLRKLVTRKGLCVVVACAAGDLTSDLNPDCIVRFASADAATVEPRTPIVNPVPSFRRRLRIERGSKSDYPQFAAMHYRDTDELGFVDQVFVLRDQDCGDLLGIVVYSHAALELALRNQATRGWFSRNPARVNKHLRVLRRLVIHPDVRGCGLGHYLVRKTMPLLGTRFVECLASLGEFNPVFQRAGMVRIGQYDQPAGARRALQSLRLMDVDPLSPQFAVEIARRPAVRQIVSDAVSDWYSATTGQGRHRPQGQPPELLARIFRGLIAGRPVYYLWRKGLHASLVRDRNRNPERQRRAAPRSASPFTKGGHRGVVAAQRSSQSEPERDRRAAPPTCTSNPVK